jgi:tetratricopeptide (TPR) repeat protein
VRKIGVFFICAFLIGSLFVLPAFSQVDEENLKALNQKVIEFYQRGDYASAIPYAEKILLLVKSEYGEKSKDYAPSLNNLALLYGAMDRYTDAEPLYKEARMINKGLPPEGKHPEYAVSLNNLAALYYSMGRYTEAEPLYKEAMVINKNLPPEGKHPNYATNLNNLASLYQYMGRYTEAEPLYKEAMEIRKILPPDGKHPDYAMSVNNLAGLYSAIGRYTEAEPLYKEAMEIRKTLPPEGEHPDYARSLNNLAGLYRVMGRYTEAEPLYKEAMVIIKKLPPEGKHPNYATSLNNLALLYNNMGRYTEAEPLYKEAMEIRKILPPEGKHPDYATSVNNLASLYYSMGRYTEAEPLYKEALAIRKTLPPDGKHPDYATSLNNLAGLYSVIGRYTEAEPLYKEAMVIYKNLPPEGKHSNYARSLNNLAGLYEDMGRYTEAEPLYKEALAIRKTLPPEGKHSDYAASLNNLAALYYPMGWYTEAEPLYKEAMVIYKNLPPEGKHPDYAVSLNNLGVLYDTMGRYTEAEPLYKEAMEIRKTLPPEGKHPDYATSLNNLALLYNNMGRYTEAEPLLKESMVIYKNLPPEGKHPNYATILNNLAVLDFCLNRYNDAESLFIQGLTINKEFISNNYITLTETEREQFYTTLSISFEAGYSFLEKSKLNNPSSITITYNMCLFTKAMLFDTTKKMIESIRNSSNQDLKNTLNQWFVLRGQLTKEYKDETAKEANNLEKELFNQSKEFALAIRQQNYTWQDVQKKLKENEAAIEIVRYQVYDKKWTDTVHYAALIVKKQSKSPEVVFLPNGIQLENEMLTQYREVMKQKTAKGIVKVMGEDSLFTAYWEKIAEKLKGIDRVILSPDGVYNLINLNTLKTKDGKYYDKEIAIVTSTRDIIPSGTKAKKINPPVIIAYPQYDLAREKQAEKVRELVNNEIDKSQVFYPFFYGVNHSGEISLAPGTLNAVNDLGKILKENKKDYQKYQGDEALEEVVKAIKSPLFLHIGTHGFFEGEGDINKNSGIIGIDEKKYFKNPLHFSGLYFVGAKQSILKKPYYKGMDDGILTAYEITNLDLEGTELVVLSACETGLGEVRNGEGVYGMQRAFQTAGAKSVLMSLWEVPDQETGEFMAHFYQLWLSGKTKREAYKETVAWMKKENPMPYYWGGFVLVGE